MESFFEELYAAYKHQVFFFVKKYVRGQDDIEDVVQDIFVHLWKYRHSLGKNTDAVVFKTAKQEIANFYRKNKFSYSDFDENISLNFAKEEETDEEKVMQDSEKIQNLLNQMPEKSKTFFLKHKVEGLSYSQIAKENSISKNAVAKHVTKVLHLLKTHLSLFFL